MHMRVFAYRVCLIAACASLLAGCSIFGVQTSINIPAPQTATPDFATPTTPAERVVTTIPREIAQQTPSPTATAGPTATELPAVSGIMDVRMFDEQVGWAYDDVGRILRTTTGVTGFQDVTPPLVLPTPAPDASAPYGPMISAVFFLDARTAFAIQRPDAVPPLDWQLITWRTTDGGQTWTSTSRPPMSMPESEGTPIQLEFIDANHGWLYMQIWPGMMHCETVILETADGGSHWQKIESSFNPDSPSTEGLLSGAYSLPYGHHVLTFLDARVGFASNGALMATTDGGHDWREQPLPRPADYPALKDPYDYRSPAWFSSPQDGVLFDRVYEFDDAPMPPGDVFMAAPHAAYLYYTHNGGENWAPQPAPALIGTPTFLDAQTGWFLGQDSVDIQARPSLWATQDGGKTWTLAAQSTPLLEGMQMQFLNAQYGIAFNPYHSAGRDLRPPENTPQPSEERLFETRDGGVTWTPVR